MSLLDGIGKNILDLPRLDSSIIQSILGSSEGALSKNPGAITNGGIEYDDQGVPLMFRDSHSAANITGSSNLWFFNVPRYKFLYFIRFIPAVTTSDAINVTSNLVDLSNQSYIVNAFQKPTVSFNSRTLNQYNKKRIVHVGINYHPVECEIWDTANSLFYDFFQMYMNFYYGDSLNKDYTAWIKDTVASKFNSGKNGWGYVIPQDSSLTTDQFLDRIQIYEFYGGDYRVTELINPKFTEVRFDNLSYEDGRGLSKFRIRLEYEGINFLEESMELLSDPDLITDMKLNQASFYEPKRLSVTNAQLNFAPSVSFNNIGADTDYITQTTESGSLGARNEQTLLMKSGSLLGKFNSGTNILGDILTQNTGTLIQNGVSSKLTNSITRGLSSIEGGVF